MQETWGSKGLSIIGVTDEAKGDTEKWIAAKGAKYAYGYDKGGALARFFGVTGIPHVVIVDATGTIVYAGGAGGYSDELLAKATAGALPKPLWEWSPAAKGVKSALLKRQYKLAIDEAAKLGASDDGPTIKAAVESMVKSKVELARSAYAKGDFLGAESLAQALSKELDGLPEKAEAQKVAEDVKANADAAEVIKLQKQVAKIREKAPTKRKDIESALEDLARIQKSPKAGYAATEAEQLVEQLRAALKKDR